MYFADIPANIEQATNTVTLISYDTPQFEWARKVLISGSIDRVQNGGSVLVSYGYPQENNWQIGDMITLTIDEHTHEVQVAGIISDVPIDARNGEWVIISSESTFSDLIGVTDYKVIEIQVSNDVSEQVRNLITPEMKLLDFQLRNNEVRTGYYAM